MTSFLHVTGIVTSIFLILSPSNVFYRIISSGSAEGFIPYPYIAGFLTCLFGFITSLVQGADDLAFLIVNLVGTLIQGMYAYLFWRKSPNAHTKYIIKISTGVGVIAIVLLIIVVHFSTKNSKEVFDVFLCLFTVASNIASIPVVPEVYVTRKVDFLPLAPIICLILNSSVSIAISFVDKDLYVMMSSLFGCFFGTSLGIFYMIFYIIQRKKEAAIVRVAARTAARAAAEEAARARAAADVAVRARAAMMRQQRWRRGDSF